MEKNRIELAKYDAKTLCEKSKDKIITCNINDIIVLLNIVDEFEIFIVNLRNFSKGSFGYSKLKNLYTYIKDGTFVTPKVKQFYLENSKVLDIIHKYSYISNFLLLYFDDKNGNYCTEIMQMFNYLKKHKVKKERILSVLTKLKEIGFVNIKFNEFLTFNDIYGYEKSFSKFYSYLDGNIEIIPNLGDDIKYKSTNANYEIRFSEIPFHYPEIILNNLLFDSCNLPESLTYAETMGKIVAKYEEKKENSLVLKNSVEFDYYLEKITLFVDKLERVLSQVKDDKEKDNIKTLLDSIRNNVSDLKKYIECYEQNAISENLFTEKVLSDIKALYKRNMNLY